MALYTLKSKEEALAPLRNYNGNSEFIRNQIAQFASTPSAAQTQLYNSIGLNSGQIASNDEQDNSQPSTLETLLSGIAKPFKDVGQSVVGMIGSGIASIKDLAEGTTGSASGYKNGTSEWVEGKNTDAFKKWLYGKDNIEDVYPEAGGKALNAAADLATLAIPAAAGAGSVATKAASSIGGNAVAGAVGGFGDEFAQNGSNATLENALKRAAVGGATGAAVGGLNKGLNSALANGTTNKLLNNRITNSVIGRGALSGAVGGALGGAGTTAIEGGDAGQIANAALSGAGTGALSGATSAAATQALSKVGAVARNKIWDLQNKNADTSIYSLNSLENGRNDRNELIKAINDYNDNVTANGDLNNQIANISDDGSMLTLNDGRTVATADMLDIINKSAFGQVKTSTQPLNNWDKLAREGGYENWDTLEQSFLEANPNYKATGSDVNAVLGWMDNNPGGYNPNATSIEISEPNSKIKSKNKLQKIGAELQRDSQEIKNQGLLDSLDEKTATRAIETGAIQKLNDLDVNSQDYKDYAETSSYVNKTVSDLAKKSGVMVEAPDLVNELSYDNINTVLTEPARKKYISIIRQITADGNSPSQYSASYLLEKSRELGAKAANLSGNTDDVRGLRSALTDAKRIVRNYANNALQDSNITGEGTSAAIAQGLQKMGTNQKVIDYYTEPNADGTAPTAKDLISRSSLFEQARDMGIESAAEKYRKSASKLPQNATTAVIRSSGIDKPLKTLLSNTVAPLSGAVTNAIGKGIEGLGNVVATPTAFSQVDSPASTVLFNNIGRQVGRNESQAVNYLANAAQEAEVLPSVPMAGNNTVDSSSASIVNNSPSTSLYNSIYGGSTSPTTNDGVARSMGISRNDYATEAEYWTDVIGKAATMALQDGDWDSFQELYSMYKGIAPTTSSNDTSAQTKLTATQQRANAAMNSLERLNQMTPDIGYDLSNIPVVGNIATLGGNDYEAEAKSLAQQIGYMVSGSNIKDSEAENIGKAYVPQPWDNEQTRKNKLRRAYEIIRQYQNGYSDGSSSGIISDYQNV